MEQLALFPKAKPARARPVEPIKRSAFIEGDYRWTLRRAWGAGPPIAWVMLNPSTADGSKDDPTLWEIMCRSLRWGYGSLVVVNIYPFRASKPADLMKWIRAAAPGWPPNTYENAKIAGAALKGVNRIVAAWGAHARRQDIEAFLDIAAAEISDDFSGGFDEDPYPFDLACLGTTSSGAPKHPLARGVHRIPVDQPLIAFQP